MASSAGRWKPGFLKLELEQRDAMFTLCFSNSSAVRRGFSRWHGMVPRVPPSQCGEERVCWWSWTLHHRGCVDCWEHSWKVGINAGSGITHVGYPAVYLTLNKWEFYVHIVVFVLHKQSSSHWPEWVTQWGNVFFFFTSFFPHLLTPISQQTFFPWESRPMFVENLKSITISACWLL